MGYVVFLAGSGPEGLCDIAPTGFLLFLSVVVITVSAFWVV